MKSILQDLEGVCFLSGSGSDLEKHHIFYGSANRKLSERYGLWVQLRHDLHNEPPMGIHFNPYMNGLLKMLGQMAFERSYPDKDFKQIFGRNYL